MNNDNQTGNSLPSISPDSFVKLDPSQVTLLDVRDPNIVLIHPVPGAINIPADDFPAKTDSVPKDKPVYVFCNTGHISPGVTEQLLKHGYKAFNVLDGYSGFAKMLPANSSLPAEVPADASLATDVQPTAPAVESPAASEAASQPAAAAAKPDAKPLYIDAKGLKCPGPIVKVADTLKYLPYGSKVNIDATEDAFASDIKAWCQHTGNKLLSLDVKPGLIQAEVEKAKQEPKPMAAAIPNGKTFVVFDDDMDRAIAAFIMANGAAAMGREVTMFFTFWGLNILRKPEKVKIKKPLVEKMFGLMMPRGSTKLPLSRMNFGGLGAKMMRKIVKDKGINSLEELMQSALDHGVHLVACQMTMDIMGIHQEELLEGVELGGVSTFLGSGEESDMTLFI